MSQAPLTISADDKSMTYGQAIPFLTASVSGFLNGDTAGALSAAPACVTAATAASPTGDYPITCSGAAAANYTITYAPGSLSIGEAELTVHGPSVSTTYGEVPGALTPTYSGFVNGDSEASLTTPATCTTTATPTSPTGAYPITCSGAVAPNYTTNHRDGTLTVNPAPLRITADNATRPYGAANPALAVSYSGFVNGDTAASLSAQPTCSTTATTSSPVGAYPITCSGAMAANYAITYAPGTLMVDRAPLTIKVDDKTKVYGQPNPPLTWTIISGDVRAQVILDAPCTTPATTGSSVGTYPIVCSLHDLPANYDVTVVPGTLTVTPAPLAVKADDKAKTYGQSNPALTFTTSGLVNGDTLASLTAPPVCATAATAASAVGAYPINCGEATAGNYTFGYQPGTLTISRARLTVTGDNASKPYGSGNPGLTASYAGFVNGDTAASLTTAPTCASTATLTARPAPPSPSPVRGRRRPTMTSTTGRGR